MADATPAKPRRGGWRAQRVSAAMDRLADHIAAEPQNRLATAASIGFKARRIGLLRTAITFLGQARAAEALEIRPRSMRAKTEATRGVADHDLLAVAAGLEKHAAALIAHAKTIRATLASSDAA